MAYDRKKIERELGLIEEKLKDLIIRYEQYFLDVERREPTRDRSDITTRLRRLANQYIPQTDLKFRYQNLASRFNSYTGQWQRILRLIDEGRYHRQTSGLAKMTPQPLKPDSQDQVAHVYDQLVAAHEALGLSTTPPSRDQVASFLAKQAEKIQEKYGNRAVEYRVVTENGKPKIKIKVKT